MKKRLRNGSQLDSIIIMGWKPLRLICLKEACSLFLLTSVLVQTTNAQSTCTIGHNNETSQTAVTESRFYLNTQMPAPCSGSISSFRYCYYGLVSMEDPREYEVAVGIYRNNVDLYELVSTKVLITLQPDELSDDFVCKNHDVDPPLDVEEGYVLGVCTQHVDQGGNMPQAPLFLAGDTGNGNYSLMYSTTNDVGGCRDGSDVGLPSSVNPSILTETTTEILHLYAEYSEITTPPPITTMMSTNPLDTTTPSSTGNVTTGDGGSPAGGGSSSAGTIAGVVVVILLLMIVSIAVAVIIVVIFVMKKRQKMYSVQRTGLVTSNAVENMTYDTAAAKERPAVLEASAYEVPASSEPHIYAEASVGFNDSFLSSHTYDVSTDNPYEMNNVYESPLDTGTFTYSELLKKNQQQDIYGDLDPYRAPSLFEDDIYAQIRSFGIKDIPRGAIASTGHLGSGQFGNVEEGIWNKTETDQILVALKALNEGSSEEDKVKFLQEAAIMAQFRHPNVIALYGVVSQGEPLMLVLELMQKGDLRQFLKSLRPDPGQLPPAELSKMLLSFSQQVALGMQYLSGKGFVHRDLAARNILVSEKRICKVSDFGMSRDLVDESYYVSHGGKIPVKWTAPEALNYKRYSVASDVWSYGCLLYEIWSLGWKPFEGISNMEVVSLVESGQRLPPPPGCPRLIYQVMMLCWNPATSPRPSFRDLVLTLVGNQQVVLSIPRDALESHKLAGVLGAPLENGEGMYEDLQKTYLNRSGADNTEERNDDYEEFD